MFDIGWGKILILGVVALIVIGPHELPDVLRNLGKTLAKLRRMASDFQYQFNQALNESGVNDIKTGLDSATTFNPVDYARNEIKTAIEDFKPASTSDVQGPPLPEVKVDMPEVHANLPMELTPPLEEPVVEEPAKKPRKKKTAPEGEA